ncbi:UDP-N-acetylmuramoyl-L-alanine--D-glutamate ligase [Maritalea myrionectae]|uniref:UDP-N-acetylmuramoyl-L-alanine--D-glutamate ligase n=1 Tax=Maritalea myrionectae TaxID=454601 RepID=UPI0004248A4F|nr:UDP-N-acetylmuramoyl-L-alanine--D-glutamate ligase [Maritalea myrionectae]
MQADQYFNRAVLLYGAGIEAKSTRDFLAEYAPDIKVYVTADQGEIFLPDSTVIAPTEIEALSEKGEIGTIVRSAGVSIYKPELLAAKKHGVEITTNINLWDKFKRKGAKLVAVTGTKGKSTTVKLTETMLECAGIDARLGGNFGVAPLDLDDHDIIVMELSSYQVADLTAQPDFVGFTNLFPEHIHWHNHSLPQYFHDKLNLLRRDGPYAYALGAQAAVNQKVQEALPKYAHELAAPSAELVAALHATMRKSRLKGPHNADNMIIAAKLALGLGAPEDAILKGLETFAPPAHRLEEHKIGNLLFVDDSIATTPEATMAAIASYPDEKIALMVGGYDRDQNYEELARTVVDSNVTALCCLPTTGERMQAAMDKLDHKIDVFAAEGLADAMEGFKRRDGFDTIILSPAAPSFNQYDNYIARGEHFIQLANELFG